MRTNKERQQLIYRKEHWNFVGRKDVRNSVCLVCVV